MAAVRILPIFEELRGAIGDSVFERRSGKIIWKPRPAYATPTSAAQLNLQHWYGYCYQLWQGLAQPILDDYARLAAASCMSAWNLWVLTTLSREYHDDGQALFPANSACPTVQTLVATRGTDRTKATLYWDTTGFVSTNKGGIYLRGYEISPWIRYSCPWVLKKSLTNLTTGTTSLTALNPTLYYCVCLLPRKATLPGNYGGSATDYC
jgi:hypothetical protein